MLVITATWAQRKYTVYALAIDFNAPVGHENLTILSLFCLQV